MGFAYVFDNPDAVHVNAFIIEFKCRVKQEWFGNISSSSVLDMYRIFKTSFDYEQYLDLVPRVYVYILLNLEFLYIPYESKPDDIHVIIYHATNAIVYVVMKETLKMNSI